jgi:predicted DNA-binding transcriptional regulator AlpA
MSDPTGPAAFPPDTVLTIPQACEALGISEDTYARNQLPVSVALGERSRRVVWADLIAFIRQGYLK